MNVSKVFNYWYINLVENQFAIELAISGNQYLSHFCELFIATSCWFVFGLSTFFVKECSKCCTLECRHLLAMAAAAMMIIFKKDPTQCLYLSWLLLSLLLLLWPLGHLRLASSAQPGRRRASYLTQEGAAGWSGSASVFYICSSQFVEEKETLRVIYLRTISAVRGGNRQKHLEQ